MELEDFITTTLQGIKKGVRNANIKIAENDGKKLGIDETIQYEIDRANKGIKFDIAVTVSGERATEGGGKIRVAVVEVGVGGNSFAKEEHVSRISFEVSAFKSVH